MGIYLLILKLPEEKTILIGKRGKICFKKGFYLYIGSAQRGLWTRINRHLRKNKTLYWHIDYLLKEAYIKEILWAPLKKDMECKIATSLSNDLIFIDHFGSSDCKCRSHLFYSKDLKILKDTLSKVIKELKINLKKIDLSSFST